VLEVTERAVCSTRPSCCAWSTGPGQRSWGIALDDIGEDPGSLAMMPFLEPDVIKLDLRLVQQRRPPRSG
jgi:EAL domain-containing protein (putative c-di-GMP-specific phosphodiesterase class I)